MKFSSRKQVKVARDLLYHLSCYLGQDGRGWASTIENLGNIPAPGCLAKSPLVCACDVGKRPRYLDLSPCSHRFWHAACDIILSSNGLKQVSRKGSKISTPCK